MGRRALVTGGAGLIGSHIVDLLLREGWSVRILDNLEPQTHRNGKPGWIPAAATFVQADVRDRTRVRQALEDIDVVFHQAAYGGYMPEIAKFVEVNSLGTAQLLEVIRDERLPVRKVVVASSQAVYREGAGWCALHGMMFPPPRLQHRLSVGDFSVHCPACGRPLIAKPTPETAPIGGETVYAITKLDQERLALTWGRQTGIPTVALRYSCTYGPRQSIFNPYTGVIAIFATRLLNGQPPVLYEDGGQMRDFVFVEDVAAANLLAALTDRLDGQAVNVGSGRGVSIEALATLLAGALDVPLEPIRRGEFRPGEMRDLISDITKARSAGFVPQTDLAAGIERYLQWIRTQGTIREYFGAAETVLRERRILHPVQLSA
ncbi:MAG: SDR family NAD(P)-dependent oxidoreductase [Candidatus Dormibacteraeota bacterium]|nr:SDR family NAD(P)-dependent oxidoreductase [Candidatus Dormibacteraeota bacterium]